MKMHLIFLTNRLRVASRREERQERQDKSLREFCAASSRNGIMPEVLTNSDSRFIEKESRHYRDQCQHWHGRAYHRSYWDCWVLQRCRNQDGCQNLGCSHSSHY